MLFYGAFYSVFMGPDQLSDMKGVGGTLLKHFWQTTRACVYVRIFQITTPIMCSCTRTHTHLPGGTGRSAKFTFLPALCALMASWYCYSKRQKLELGFSAQFGGKPPTNILSCSESTHFIRTSVPLQRKYIF